MSTSSESARPPAGIIAVVTAGGVIGACARYGAGLAWPTPPGGFPWTTWWINVTGCAAMGVLMVLVTERFSPNRLLRPFLGTGILGGYTTFSTATLDTRHLLDGGHPGRGLMYAATTLLASVAAVWAASAITRAVVPPRSPAEDGA
ncbi:CrcB family protein [Actinocorallia longicatena]|uniref:Fluoride-specific ion channel FluC n=1 Tax=Actinocorallia longicatena TaxID=111803 RepID=A0ABP6QCN9_9ACTN